MLNNEDMGTEIKVSVPAGLRVLGARCPRCTPIAAGSPSGAARSLVLWRFGGHSDRARGVGVFQIFTGPAGGPLHVQGWGPAAAPGPPTSPGPLALVWPGWSEDLLVPQLFPEGDFCGYLVLPVRW